LNATPDTRDPSAGARAAGRWTISVLLAAMLGVLALAGAAGSGTSPGAGTLHPATAAAVGDPALLRSDFRLPRLQPAQPSCGGADPDGDSPTGPVTGASAAPGCDRLIAPAFAGPDPAAPLRPLHGRPQSPRAPPYLG
jgi:hypothetical protein